MTFQEFWKGFVLGFAAVMSRGRGHLLYAPALPAIIIVFSIDPDLNHYLAHLHINDQDKCKTPKMASSRSQVLCCHIMGTDQPSDSEHRVVPLPRRAGSAANAPRRPAGEPPPVKDLRQYEQGETPDDYRHRMFMNIAAFVFLALLIAAGLWLADTMAQMRKNQDCVLSGRRGCTPVDVQKDRW